MFSPRLALASLSGESDAAWARMGAPYAGAAFLGGLSLDEPTQRAARTMVAERDREEFLPADPFAFIRDQLADLSDVSVRPGINVRAIDAEPIRRAARICADHDAILEINAHCRQDEMRAAGAGEALLENPDRFAEQVAAAARTDAAVSVKVRAEVPGVDLPALAARLEAVGADAIHVDAMDSEAVVAEVVGATDAFVIANNGVRDAATTREYLAYGADAVSVGRPSDDPAVLARVSEAVEEWFE
ncbi:tRNA-dihydrouridine synthase [Halanaeroarchaeum sulfurireducens]|uniref:tRNA dihydrouridine synthase B-like protein n=1 Tax=Halanaeroarchaeum sulfurireducens TaxID=1604004 RepID=A0A0F7PAH7_9EURY|nr:tRNA-dihydrouridine synthase [Halanaeroarchaeum sulfurireducens]AKH98166.1 tRNA dihydrouridine synthase B-like protein [Halanaeroarchaeum sulfurireducens]ALG82560.1 tRNA dihydrouridine synthase B-like protein [Halanaeroarchaeum sulfurireducens]